MKKFKPWDVHVGIQLLLLLGHLLIFWLIAWKMSFLILFFLGHSWSYTFLHPGLQDRVKSKRYRFSLLRFLVFFVMFVHKIFARGKEFDSPHGMVSRLLTLIFFFVLIMSTIANPFAPSARNEFLAMFGPLIWGWALGEGVRVLFFLGQGERATL